MREISTDNNYDDTGLYDYPRRHEPAHGVMIFEYQQYFSGPRIFPLLQHATYDQ